MCFVDRSLTNELSEHIRQPSNWLPLPERIIRKIFQLTSCTKSFHSYTIVYIYTNKIGYKRKTLKRISRELVHLILLSPAVFLSFSFYNLYFPLLLILLYFILASLFLLLSLSQGLKVFFVVSRVHIQCQLYGSGLGTGSASKFNWYQDLNRLLFGSHNKNIEFKSC